MNLETFKRLSIIFTVFVFATLIVYADTLNAVVEYAPPKAVAQIAEADTLRLKELFNTIQY